MPESDSNLIIFLAVAVIIFFIYGRHTQCTKQVDNKYIENFSNVIKKRKHKKYKKRYYRNTNNTLDPVDIDGLCDAMKSPSYRANIENTVNTDFVEMQYHKDYNDTITAINNLTSQKELFNMGFLPVKQSEPDQDNIEALVQLFMGKLNKEVTANVSEYLHVNSGWNDMGKRRREKSGFEEQMEELGLPGQVYNEPAAKAGVKLIKIDKAEQFNTNDQIRFIAYIIVQKVNAKDQMVLKVQFFMEREDLKAGGDNRANFFEKDLQKDNVKIDDDNLVIVEQVFTVGYLTNDAKKKSVMDKFHDYGQVERIDGTIDQSKILKIMMQKHKERSKELNAFLCTVDDETKELHDVPGIGDYQSYKNTRTIMDDLAQFPQHSFGGVPI
jgi:hypothetical protein